MTNKVKIKLKCFDHRLVDSSIRKILEIVKLNNIRVAGPIPLPRKKEIFTILRAPHIYKDSREQFERITYKRLIYIYDPTEKVMRDLGNLILPYGVSVYIKSN